MEWAILEHSWLHAHQQSWLASTAEAQELMISAAPLCNFLMLFRGQVPAHRIDLLLRRSGLPPFGLAGHLCLWALGVAPEPSCIARTHACMPGTVQDSYLNFKPFMFLCFIIFVVLWPFPTPSLIITWCRPFPNLDFFFPILDILYNSNSRYRPFPILDILFPYSGYYLPWIGMGRVLLKKKSGLEWVQGPL